MKFTFYFQFAANKMMPIIGKSRAKVYVETDTKVTFKDVAGGLTADQFPAIRPLTKQPETVG